jgi:hypothetical protein
MEFTHEVIDGSPPCGRLGICQPTDLTGNGRPDLIVGGMGAETLPIVGTSGLPLVGRLLRRLETSVFWYENPGWERHAISTTPNLYVFGNALGDVTGNGRVDLLVGQGVGRRDIYWFEQPDDPREPWTRFLVGSEFDKYHDLAFGDVDNDGEPELVGTSQESEVVFYYDVPDDPREPWPDDCLHVVAENTNVEGLEIVDIDGDGRNELIAGTSIYRQTGNDSDGPRAGDGREGSPGKGRADGGSQSARGQSTDGGQQTARSPQARDGESGPVAAGWRREPIVTDWDWTRVAVGDLDGDGEPEVVFTEGDSPHLGSQMGRVGWFDPPDWEPHVLRYDMYCPHSVQLADFDGNGHLDIYVAEIGLGTNDEDATHVIFRNQGGGEFEETVIERGIPTHEAKAVDVNGNGRIDIVGKSYSPNTHVDVWYND